MDDVRREQHAGADSPVEPRDTDDADLEAPAFLGRPFGEPQSYRPGALRGSGALFWIALLLVFGGLIELRRSSYGLAAVLGIVGLAAGWAAFLLFRKYLPGDIGRDPREQLAEFSRYRRR